MSAKYSDRFVPRLLLQVIGTGPQGREVVGTIILKKGRYKADPPKTWQRVGVISVYRRGMLGEKLLYLYRDDTNYLCYELYISGAFYPMFGRISGLTANLDLSFNGIAYRLDGLRAYKIRRKEEHAHTQSQSEDHTQA